MSLSLASSKGLLAVILATAGIGSAVVANIGGGGGGELGGTEPPPMAGSPMAATMIRVGLDAERLAAVGVTSQAASGAIAAATTEHDEGEASLAEADTDYSSSKSSCSAPRTSASRRCSSGRCRGSTGGRV